MPDPSEPASGSPANSRTATQRTQRSRIKPPRLLLVTDLSHGVGRQHLVAIDEQMQARLPDWRLSVRDLRDIDQAAVAKPDALGFDATLIEGGDGTARLHRCNQPVAARIAINQRLAGHLLADVLLRRGFRHFLWNKSDTESRPEESEFAIGFHEEMRNADLSVDGHFHAAAPTTLPDLPSIAAIIAADSPAAIVANLNPFAPTVDSRPNLSVAASAHWLATAVTDQLSPDPAAQTAAATPSPLIPPVLANSAAEIEALPTNLTDMLIAEVSSRIDELLQQHHATNAAELSREFATARRTLERRFREQLGTSIHREITRRQVADARIHLLSPHIMLSDVAQLTGYPTTRMLSINFRKLQHLSPRAFRREHLAAWL